MTDQDHRLKDALEAVEQGRHEQDRAAREEVLDKAADLLRAELYAREKAEKDLGDRLASLTRQVGELKASAITLANDKARLQSQVDGFKRGNIPLTLMDDNRVRELVSLVEMAMNDPNHERAQEWLNTAIDLARGEAPEEFRVQHGGAADQVAN